MARRPPTTPALACATAIVASFAGTPALWAAGDAGAPDVKGSDQAARGPSFDCAKASTRTEKMICADGELSGLDGELARAYRGALAKTDSAASLKTEQHAWLTNQRNKCFDVACLREAYEKRLAGLKELATRPTPPSGSPFVPPKPERSGTPAVRKVQFAGKETTITREKSPIAGLDDFERITVRNAQGRVESESSCNVGDFDAYSALYTRLRDAAVRDNRAAIVNLMAYPLRVNDVKGKKSRTFRKQAALLKEYDKVFNPDVLEAIRRLEPADLFCRDGSVTSGGGMLWADDSGGDDPKVSVINR